MSMPSFDAWLRPCSWLLAGVVALGLKTAFMPSSHRTWRGILGEAMYSGLSILVWFWLLPDLADAWFRKQAAAQPLAGVRGVLALLAMAVPLGAALAESLLRWLWRQSDPALQMSKRYVAYAGATALWIGLCFSGGYGSALLKMTQAPLSQVPKFEIYFVDRGWLCTLRPWRGNAITRLMPITRDPECHLSAASGPDGMYLKCLFINGQTRTLYDHPIAAPSQMLLPSPAFSNLDGKLGVRDRHLSECFWALHESPDMPSTDWRVSLAPSPSGVVASHWAGQHRTLRMDLPGASWVARCGSLVQDRWVVLQLGPQICIWDLKEDRLHLLARGSSPLVILR